jgi:mRNA interferase MazF
VVIRQYDICIVALDPTLGAEIQKTRPCLVISPDEMNGPLQTVQVAPMTSNVHAYPWRVPIAFQGKEGHGRSRPDPQG